MWTNPYAAPGNLGPPIDREDCQLIHYRAIRAAVRGFCPEAVPASLPLAALQERARLDGAEAYLLHPADIEGLFAGVTLAVYRTVRSLYCSRLGRSIKMVWRILSAMAQAASSMALPYEAVWALCLSLEDTRRASLEVPLERGQDTWWLGQTTPDIVIQEQAAPLYQPTITWCVEMGESRALAFHIALPGTVGEQRPLALYDGIVALRRPLERVTTGLLWHLPKRIATTVPLSSSHRAACARAGIEVEKTAAEPPLIQAVRDRWERGVAGRTLPGGQCARLLDTYLARAHGYGPLRERERSARELRSRVGYTQDPAWQFPLLRAFLPAAASSVAEEGVVAYDGLHYTHELLSYWPGHAVTIRRSAHMEAAAWIYLDGEILCLAYARELRRRDGSYRYFR
jgi:hypothetical protein